MKSENKTYNFSWDDLGDIELGRPNLGPTMDLVCYRLMEYTFKDVLSKEFGNEKTKEIFIAAGRLAGEQFCKNALNAELSFDNFIMQDVLDRSVLQFKSCCKCCQ